MTRTLVESAQLSVDALLTRLQSNTEGLTNHKAAQRYQAECPNSLVDSEHNGLWRRVLPILASPLSLLLLALALLNWFTGGHEGAIVIAAMVVLSALFSFAQEYRSCQPAEALRSLAHTKVSLRRRMRQEDGTFPGTGHPVHVPLAPALGLTRLPPGYRWALAAILAGYLALTQLVKMWVVRRSNLT